MGSMIQTFIGFSFLVFFLAGCAESHFQSQTEKSQSSEDDWLWLDEANGYTDQFEMETTGTLIKKVCKTSQFTIYSRNEECPDIRKEKGDEYELVLDTSHLDSDSLSGKESKPVSTSNLKPVDIFFVVNASSSMWYYLDYMTASNNQRFQGRFSYFIPILNLYNLDWRMFFTNSHYSNGFFKGRNGKAMKLENRFSLSGSRVLSPESKNPTDLFTYTITRGPDRMDDHSDGQNCTYPPYCGNVRPLESLKAGFSANRELTRQSADFIAIIVSNRDEKEEVSPEEVIREFRKVHGPDKKLSVLSLIILPGDSQCHAKNEKRTFFLFHRWQKTSPGSRIAELAKQTGGGNFSICLKDYSILAKAIVNLSHQN